MGAVPGASIADGVFTRADELGIEIIPLVQCLGHSENVLSKKRFKHLREVKDDVGEFCPSNPASAGIINDLVEDVMSLAGGRIKHFHLGGDEAWHMGSCPRCKKAVKARGRDAVYLNHVGPILDNLEDCDVKPILWDDMMRKWPIAALKKLGARADLMAWSYGAEPIGQSHGFLTEEHLAAFRRARVTVWGGSAYKGGDGAFVDVPDLEARNANNVAFARAAGKHALAGVVATAWSRYNTFLSPCETIEASLDALVLAAAAMWDGSLPEDAKKHADGFLKKNRRGVEWKRFSRCRKAASDLGKWKGALEWFAGEAEQAAHVNGEPERLNVGVVKSRGRRIRKLLAQGGKLGAAFKRAHAGLIPDRWLKLYVESRLKPMMRRCRNLKGA